MIQITYSVNPVIEVHILIGQIRRCGPGNWLFGFGPILIYAALISHDFPHTPGDLRYVLSHIVRHVLIAADGSPRAMVISRSLPHAAYGTHHMNHPLCPL